MLTQEEISQDKAVARCTLYKDLSAAFCYPRQDTWSPWVDGSFRRALEKSMGAEKTGELPSHLEEELSFLELEVPGAELDDLEDQYMKAFDLGWPEPPCPPNEGLHSSEGIPRQRLLLNLAKLYRHFGLKVDERPETSQLADHLAIELELLHFLTFKEAQALEEGDEANLDGYRRAQFDFLDHHPSRWLPTFAARAGQHASPIYIALVELTAGVIKEELERTRKELSTETSPS